MNEYKLLADYRQFKAGDVVVGYEEALPMGAYTDYNLVVEVDGMETLIPMKFVEPVKSKFGEKLKQKTALVWLLVFVVLILLMIVVRSLISKK